MDQEHLPHRQRHIKTPIGGGVGKEEFYPESSLENWCRETLFEMQDWESGRKFDWICCVFYDIILDT